MSQVAIEVKEREAKENGRKLRRNGQVPGIIYGEFLDNPIPIKVENLTLSKLLKYNSKGSILKLKLNDDTRHCVVKDVQKNTIAGEIIHVDFQYVKESEVIKMNIPINYVGRENLELKKLVLETFLPELELQGAVEKIPEYIELNISQMNYEDKIFAKDVQLPEEVKLITDPDALLAVVNG
ncbi:50S ribosomal protein L25 [Clostridium sp. JNZ J1-5]|nr:50S ribosomal protein L25 [Clostridium sp.]